MVITTIYLYNLYVLYDIVKVEFYFPNNSNLFSFNQFRHQLSQFCKPVGKPDEEAEMIYLFLKNLDSKLCTNY